MKKTKKSKGKTAVKEITINITLMLIVIGTSFILFDIYIRFAHPEDIIGHSYDDELIHVMIPNTHFVEMVNGKRIHSDINSLGFRGEEFEIVTSKKRVMVYGDSFIEGFYTPEDQTYVKQLEYKVEAELQEDIEVINAGIRGYGPDQLYTRIKKEVDIYNPDLIVLSVFVGNDFGEMTRNKMFRFNEKGEFIENQFTINKMQRIKRTIASYFPSAMFAFRVKNNLLRRNTNTDDQRTYLQKTLDRRQQQCEEFLTKKDNEVKSSFGDSYDFHIAVNPNDPCASHDIRAMNEIIKKTSEFLKNKNIPMVLLIIPSNIDVEDEKYESLIKEEEMQAIYNRSRVTDIMEGIAKDHNITLINLHPIYKEQYKKEKRKLYIEGDSHWNEYGQKIAASVTMPLIVERLTQEE